MTLSLLKVFFIGANHFFFTLAATDSSNLTINCVVQAVNLIAKRKIALEFAEHSRDLATEILHRVKIPVVLNSIEHRKPTGIDFRVSVDVLLLLKDVEAGEILNDTLWNGDTRFLIITDDEQKIGKHFENFWKLKVINVFGMVMTEGNVSLYSFLPYGKNNCSKAELIIADTCLNGKLQNGGSALKDSIRIKNMNQCPINITITHVRPSLIFEPENGRNASRTAKGFEGKFMVEVSKVYNFNGTFKMAEDGIGWGWIHPSPRGVIGDLYRGLTDMTVGLQAPFIERYENFDFAASFNLDECVTFSVPQGYRPKKATWLTIFVLEFTSPTWSLIFISFTATCLNTWLINRLLKMNWFRNNVEITIFVFASCVGNPIKTPNFISAKTSIIFWIVFSFIITVAYKASMGSKLTVPPRDEDINTFEELLDSDLELIGVKNMIQLFEYMNRWPYTELKNRYKYSNDCIDHMVARLANREKIAYLRHKTSVYYYSLMNPDARGRVHVIEDCLYPYHPSALLKKFSPFTRRVSQTVRRLEESGIMEMWRAEFVKKFPPPKKPFFKLSIDQMLGVFCFLLMGYVVALMSFLWEFIFIFGVRKPLLPFGCFGFRKERVVVAKQISRNDSIMKNTKMSPLLLNYFLLGAHPLLCTFATDTNQIATCILEAVHLVARRKIALEFTDDTQDLASEILRRTNIPVVLNSVEHRKPSGIEHRTSIDVLLLLRDAEAGKILNDTLWNGDTRFIIVAEDEETIDEQFESFWKFKVINVFGLVITKLNVSLYSFLPYGKNNCTKAEPILVDNCLNGKLKNGGGALTDSMRIKNMNQCPVNITITHVRPNLIFEPENGRNASKTVKGFEGKLMVEVAKLYNFNATFKIAEDGVGWGWIHPSPRGAIGDLWVGICDITVGMLGPFVERYEYLDLAVNYNLDECVTFAVPQGYGTKRATWLAIFILEFTFPSWSLIIFSFVAVAINIWLINKFLDVDWFKTKIEMVTLIFASCVGNPVKTPHFVSARTSVIFWIFFTFIVTVAYKASMGSKLAVPPRDPDIDTFEELLDSDLELMGVRNMIQLFPTDECIFKEINNRYRYTNDCIDHMVARMGNREKVAYLRHRSSFYYYSLMNPRARGRIHVIKDCVYPYHPHAALKKFSPFTRRVSQIVRRLEESGIAEMWRSEFIKKMTPPKKPFFKLSIDQMLGVFCFLLVGYVVALLSFLCEFVFIVRFRKPLWLFACFRFKRDRVFCKKQVR